MRKYIAIEDQDGDGMYCLGIFDDRRAAVGAIMDSVWDFQSNYKGKGDYFSFSGLEPMEGNGGEVMEVTFKASCWEQPLKHHMIVLYADE